MKRPIRETVARYATALVLLGARWLLMKVGGSARSTEPSIPARTRPNDGRPLMKLAPDVYAEWCLCGAPPIGTFVVVETQSGRLIACHPECLAMRAGRDDGS